MPPTNCLPPTVAKQPWNRDHHCVVGRGSSVHKQCHGLPLENDITHSRVKCEDNYLYPVVGNERTICNPIYVEQEFSIAMTKEKNFFKQKRHFHMSSFSTSLLPLKVA